MSFALIECWAAGSTPMLQNRATEEGLAGSTRSNNPVEAKDPRVICEEKVYRLDNEQLAIPGAALARMLREAGSSHKSKGSRKSIKYLVPAAVIVLDDLCGLYLPDRTTALIDYEVDSRPVTIPATKGRVMRHRARFNRWAVRFRLRINEEVLEEGMIRRLMTEGLQQIGLGDFRPEKGGPFGTSDLVSWQRENALPVNAADKRNGGKVARAA
jgi:hypothetical protein